MNDWLNMISLRVVFLTVFQAPATNTIHSSPPAYAPILSLDFHTILPWPGKKKGPKQIHLPDESEDTGFRYDPASGCPLHPSM